MRLGRHCSCLASRSKWSSLPSRLWRRGEKRHSQVSTLLLHPWCQPSLIAPVVVRLRAALHFVLLKWSLSGILQYTLLPALLKQLL